MRTTRTPWTGIGLTSWAFFALLNAGCQPGASQQDKPAPLPTLGVEAASDVPHSPAPTAEAMPATSPLETLKQEAGKVEPAVDPAVQKTAGEVEQAALQPLPPPTTPAPDPAAAPAPAAVLEQGVQEVTGEIQQTADELKQDLQRAAEKLEKKARKGYDRARDQIQGELAPKAP